MNNIVLGLKLEIYGAFAVKLTFCNVFLRFEVQKFATVIKNLKFLTVFRDLNFLKQTF